MLYSREILIKKGYAKESEESADFNGRISKFDKKEISPFLKELKELFEKHDLIIESNLDGTLVITKFNSCAFERLIKSEVDT